MFEQFGMCAAFDDLSPIHHQDQVRGQDGAQPVGYDDAGAAHHYPFESLLYERLALSRDKKKIKQLSQKGQIVERTSDLIKEPYVLEFLGLQDKPAYSESQLEYHSECIPRSLLRG